MRKSIKARPPHITLTFDDLLKHINFFSFQLLQRF